MSGWPTRIDVAADFSRDGKRLVVLPPAPALPNRSPAHGGRLRVEDGYGQTSSSPKGALGLRFGIRRSRMFRIVKGASGWTIIEIRPEPAQFRFGGIDFWVIVAALAVATLMIVAAAQVQGQTITVLHSFSTRADGSLPYAGVTIDRAGNLYGTTSEGANGNVGTVFKLIHTEGGWTLNTLYTFDHPNDGFSPAARVVFGPDGSLYGTTQSGGQGGGGVVYNLRPPATACKTVLCSWTYTTLYSFTGASDGGQPYLGDLVFDSAGNIYGTTQSGGGQDCFGLGCGVVFKLSHSGGGWTETVLYTFTGGNDGANPFNGVTFDRAGNLYGTTVNGGSGGYGTVYELSPTASGWTLSTLYSFTGGLDGGNPIGGVAIDAHGNLYGTTEDGGTGTGGGGTVWELAPSNGSWTFSVLQSLSTVYEGPFDTPTLDAAGNIYGTSTFAGGNGQAFKLTSSGGGWSYAPYDFNGNNGNIPIGCVTLDANGNMYGTTSEGGSYTWGTVWEITP